MSLTSLLVGKQAPIDKELDSLFKLSVRPQSKLVFLPIAIT